MHTASSGHEALSLFDEIRPIALLLTDVVMPEMSGRELANSLRARDPGLKVCYMSGYCENAIAHHGVLDRDTALIEKPFTAEGLLRTIRRVTDGEP